MRGVLRSRPSWSIIFLYVRGRDIFGLQLGGEPVSGMARVAAWTAETKTMGRLSILWVVLVAFASSLLTDLSLPLPVRADGGVATFFIAHADTHAEATSSNPISASGATPVIFELRIRDAGSAEKAGWQAALAIDACVFETPAESAIVLGDMFGAAVPVRQVLAVQNDVVKLKMGQVMFTGSAKADTGLLASVTLTPKATRACPSGGTGMASQLSQVAFATTPLTQWVAPGGGILPFQTRTGYLARKPGAVTLVHFGATSGAISWPLIAAGALAVLAGAAGFVRLSGRGRIPG